MMGIKRYEPGAYGAMNESEDGKFYHKRDVERIVLLAKEILSLPEREYFLNKLKEWGVK